MLDGTKAMFVGHGYSPADAAHRAYAMVDGMVQQHAAMLAFNDAFWILGMMFLLITPAVFLMRANKPGAADATHVH